MHQPKLTNDGIPERFLLGGHRPTKRFVDDYEYIRIYLLQDIFECKVARAEFPFGRELLLSVQADVCGG
jgi:hypothetical protein